MADELRATSPAGDSVEEIAAALWQRAAELWGPERAGQLGHVLDDAARDIWTIAQAELSEADDPAFYPH